MTCNCGKHNLRVNASKASKEKNLRIDPTRTTTLRKRFVADMVRRFTKLKREIVEAVVTQDVFGLNEPERDLDMLLHATPRQFDFPRSSDKVNAFMRWLNDMEKQHILTVIHRPGRIGQAVEEAWTDTYIESAYKQGIRRAGQELKKAGVNIPIPAGELGVDTIALSFNMPVHADRVGLIYTRVFSELNGVTKTMDQQISRVLAQGLAEGRNPRYLARVITERVNKIGITRAKMIARTEVVRAHHMASIQEYKNAGLLGVMIQSEWLTAGFNVCPECEELSKGGDIGNGVYSIAAIEPMIPVHPNCRCCAIPYLPGISDERPRATKSDLEQ